MKLRSLFIFLSLSLSLSLSIFSAQQKLLSSGDVRGVMRQLFEYHIDKKEMQTVLLERSLKIYIKQFDPTYAYFLQDEIFTYLHPTEQTLRKMLNDYEKDRFTHYFALNQKIQDSIVRARAWRQIWEQNPTKLIEDAKKIKIEKEKSPIPARNITELKERHYRRFVEFLSYQLQELKMESIDGHEKKIVSLCEKQIANMENEYLGWNDQNGPQSAAEQEHFVILRILKALAQSLDAHTAYYSPDEAHAMKVQLEKGMCGIGVVLKEGIDGVIIQEILVGGPAALSGKLQKGDVIIEIDGNSIQGFSFHRVLDLLKGGEGTKTTLGILRKISENQDFVRVELVRSKITLGDKRVDVEAEPFGDGFLGKITLYSFYEGEDGLSSEKDIKKAIDQLRAKGPLYGLILDMRENTGGFLSQAVRVSGLFISCGVVVVSKYSDGSIKYYRAIDGKRFYDGPLVVLISRGSASATEIVAQTLKDYGVAVVIGDEKTYGKGTIQHQTVTNDGSNSFFKVTIGRYYTVSGQSTQIDGVQSDIIVPTELSFEDLGESFLEYPLPSDFVASTYQDNLDDIDPVARRWFQKYYLPTLQQKESQWMGLVPILRANSKNRLEQNKNFQLFLKQIKEKIQPIDVHSFGSNDLQMEEAVNIIKDMIFMSQATLMN
jgi:carboxyl-terminal processing protease